MSLFNLIRNNGDKIDLPIIDNEPDEIRLTLIARKYIGYFPMRSPISIQAFTNRIKAGEPISKSLDNDVVFLRYIDSKLRESELLEPC